MVVKGNCSMFPLKTGILQVLYVISSAFYIQTFCKCWRTLLFWTASKLLTIATCWKGWILNESTELWWLHTVVEGTLKNYPSFQSHIHFWNTELAFVPTSLNIFGIWQDNDRAVLQHGVQYWDCTLFRHKNLKYHGSSRKISKGYGILMTFWIRHPQMQMNLQPTYHGIWRISFLGFTWAVTKTVFFCCIQGQGDKNYPVIVGLQEAIVRLPSWTNAYSTMACQPRFFFAVAQMGVGAICLFPGPCWELV